MFMTIFLWLLIIFSLELITSVTSLRALSFCMFLVLSSAAIIFKNGLELMALTCIIAFSATTLLLYLLVLCVEGSARASAMASLSRDNISSPLAFFLFLVLFVSMATTVNTITPIYLSRWFDMVSALNLPSSNLLSTIHSILTRFFILESCVLNVLLMVCFFCSITLLMRALRTYKYKSTRVPTSVRVKRAWRRFSSVVEKFL